MPAAPVDAAVKAIDAYIAECDELRVVLVMNLGGEVFPCGCVDGQTGGLVSLLPAAKRIHPNLLMSLGDNYAPRTPLKDAGDRAYFDDRRKFVQTTVHSCVDTLEALGPLEQDQQHGQDARVFQVGDVAVELIAARSEQWQAPQPFDAESRVRIVVLAGELLPKEAAFTGVDRVLWFRVPLNDTLPGNLSIHEPPLPGGRGLVTLTIYIPKVWKREIRMLNEFTVLRDTLKRTADGTGNQATFHARIAGKAASLLENAPALIGLDYIKITSTDPVDPTILQGYGELVARHGAPSAIVPGIEAGAACQPCHSEFVEAFREHDAHLNANHTLQRVDKANDPFCLSCHTTPVAPKDSQAAMRPELAEGVRCEWCHLGHEAHVANPERFKPLPVDTATCEACHNENQSPQYVWSEYLPKLSCHKTKKGR